MKKIIIMLLVFLQTFAFASLKGDQIKSVMKSKIDTAVSLIEKKRGQKSLRKEIENIFDEVFDYELMAKLSLGKSQFSLLNDKQQKEFTYKFEKKLKDSFFDNLNSYNNEKIQIVGLKDGKKRKILQTKLIKPDKVYTIDYKFYLLKDQTYLIYDVEILGISIIQTFKNQFARVLIDSDFNKLLALLEKSKISQ